MCIEQFTFMQILIDRSSTVGRSNKSKCSVARHENKKVLQNILIDKQNDFFSEYKQWKIQNIQNIQI